MVLFNDTLGYPGPPGTKWEHWNLNQRNHGCIEGVGSVKPVYIISISMNTAAGAMEPAKVELIEPMVRNTMDIVKRQVNENSQNTKKA
ncbi:MAG: hypothetical protein Q9180_000971 [Flavoplaca navasiana]